MPEQVSHEPAIIAHKTRENNLPVTIIDFGKLGTVTFQGWAIPDKDSIQGARLGLQVKNGDLILSEAHKKAVEIDLQRQQKEPKKPGYPQPSPRNYAATALSLVIGPIPKN